jgi:uncharacterized membrane-anchored protein
LAILEKLNKVAGVTLTFWVMKILATTLGETLGDLLSMTLNIGYFISLLITLAFFLIALAIQLNAKHYYPIFYWLVVVGTTTLGTEISDFMDRSLGLGYIVGSLLLFSALLLVLYIWYSQEKSLNYYPVTKPNIELYYWIAVLFSNSLGTAFGDFLSDNAGLSYGYAALVTAAIIFIVALLHYFSKLNKIALFWVAFIFTRPFGATFGDLLTKPLSKGGLNLGTIPSTVISTLLLSVLVIYCTYNNKTKIDVAT